jgi:hypothetical protein
MKRTVFAPAARDEFGAAAEWYESQAPGLGFLTRSEGLAISLRTAPRPKPQNP